MRIILNHRKFDKSVLKNPFSYERLIFNEKHEFKTCLTLQLGSFSIKFQLLLKISFV